jgi:hypothetical protein
MSKPVIVTTLHRGVFFGHLSDDQDEASKVLILTNCRNAIRWVGRYGFVGLAGRGPEKGSRIGAPAPRVMLHDVTSVSDCTEAAAEKWESWE